MGTITHVGHIVFEAGSGNPYADLGLPDADEMLLKAGLVHEIEQIIQRKELTTRRAANLLDIPKSQLSKLLCGNFRTIPQDQISEYLNRLTAI